MLFCMAAACLLGGGIALYENIDYRLHSQRAVMELAHPDKKVTVPVGGYDVHLLDVRYVAAAGDLVVPQKRVSGDVARRLASGEKLPITYLTNNPQHVWFDRVELPNPWGWLGLGVVLSATFLYALKLIRREHKAR